jgi:hypothetical protein
LNSLPEWRYRIGFADVFTLAGIFAIATRPGIIWKTTAILKFREYLPSAAEMRRWSWRCAETASGRIPKSWTAQLFLEFFTSSILPSSMASWFFSKQPPAALLK